jgi:hypothetical protein
MGGQGMKKPNQYEWLVIVEGGSDIGVYQHYLKDSNAPNRYKFFNVGGKGRVKNINAWKQECLDTLSTDLGRTGFKGVLLVVDSDDNTATPFCDYVRGNNIRYIGEKPDANMDESGEFWHLDKLNGIEEIPLRGINVPRSADGCIETELLSSYGFPIKSQPEYTSLVGIIKQASEKWNIPNTDDGNPWWSINETAKMDKFIYAALKQGFVVSRRPPCMPSEPDIIAYMRKAMDFSIYSG